MTREQVDDKLILLTGATGYVGGRLLRVLEQRGYRVRCLARRPEFLKPKVSGARARATEIVAGDVLDLGSLRAALRGVSVAYYLVHSMGSAGSFEENDRQSARNFGAAAKAEGVERIIYLGALGNDGETLVRCAFVVGRHSCVRRRTVGLSFAFYAAEPICVLNPTVEVSRDLHQNDWEYD